MRKIAICLFSLILLCLSNACAELIDFSTIEERPGFSFDENEKCWTYCVTKDFEGSNHIFGTIEFVVRGDNDVLLSFPEFRCLLFDNEKTLSVTGATFFIDGFLIDVSLYNQKDNSFRGTGVYLTNNNASQLLDKLATAHYIVIVLRYGKNTTCLELNKSEIKQLNLFANDMINIDIYSHIRADSDNVDIAMTYASSIYYFGMTSIDDNAIAYEENWKAYEITGSEVKIQLPTIYDVLIKNPDDSIQFFIQNKSGIKEDNLRTIENAYLLASSDITKSAFFVIIADSQMDDTDKLNDNKIYQTAYIMTMVRQMYGIKTTNTDIYCRGETRFIRTEEQYAEAEEYFTRIQYFLVHNHVAYSFYFVKYSDDISDSDKAVMETIMNHIEITGLNMTND